MMIAPAWPQRWRPSAFPYGLGPASQIALIGVVAFLLFLFTAAGLVVQLALIGLVGIFALAIWKWPLAGVFALVTLGAVHPFLMLLLFHFTGSAGAVKAAQLWKELVLLVLLAKALDIALRRRIAPSISLFDLGLVVFLIYATFYVAYPSSLASSTLFTKVSGLRADTSFLLAYFVGRGIPLSIRQVRLIVIAFMTISFVMACIAVVQFLAPNATNTFFNSIGFANYIAFERGDNGVTSAVRQDSIDGSLIPRASSLVLSDLGLAFYMLLAAPVAAGLLIAMRSVRATVTSNVLLVLMVGTTVFTATRSAILAIVPVLAGVFVRAGAIILALVVAVEGFVLGLPIVVRLGLTPTLVQQIFSPNEASTAGHLIRLRDSLRIIEDRPLGRGLGTAGEIAQRFSPAGGTTSEDWYLQIGIEMGVIASVMFILLLVAIFVVMLLRYRQVHDPWLRALCLGMAGATLGFGLVGLTLQPWDSLTTAIIFWLLAGIAVQGPRIEAREAGG